MSVLILIVAVIFSIITLFANFPTATTLNPFNGYFIFGLNFIREHFIFFFLGFALLAFVMTRILKFEKNHPKHKKLFTYFTQSLAVLIIGIFVSYLILIVVALLELNLLSLTVNINPHFLGIINDRNKIVNALKANNQPPLIIATDNNQYKELQAIALATTGKTNFYGASILPSIPSFFVLPIKNLGSSILLDRTLIISQINPQDLQTVSPVIGYLFIKSYFPNRYIKFPPKIYMMDENEYQKYRDIDFNKKIADVTLALNQTNQDIATSSAAIQEDKNNIASNQNFIKSTYATRDKQYNQCMAVGHYQGNTFYHTNSKDYCLSLVQSLDNATQNTSDALDFWNSKLVSDQNQLATSRLYANFYNLQVQLGGLLKQNIPHELGSFFPPDTIKILINAQSPHALADYFETVVHEYLHYASNIDGKSFTASFFEEGLTEYFARRAIQDNLDVSTNLGYPVYVKIIAQMTKIIPESELADIYFSKDEMGLRTALDQVYGDNFYEANLINFETLQYTSDPKQILKLANNIMAKINGTPLKESDIISTTSNL